MPTVAALILDWNDFTAERTVSLPERPGVGYRTLSRVTLRLHDTAARKVRDFQPVLPGRASVYVCGATVQGAPHLGHLRSAVSFDILVRWLEASGYTVTYCRNVTDVDDKILRAAAAEGIAWWALAVRNARSFADAYRLLGCRLPDVDPRAAGHIPDMIALMERLFAADHAYEAGGDVYFDVRTAAGYGSPSRPRPGEVRPGGGGGPRDEGARARERGPR